MKMNRWMEALLAAGLVCAAATASVRWFVRNQRPDGSWLYQYDRRTGETPDAYNVVRHAGAIMGLYQAATAGIDGALESADRGTAWTRSRLVDHDGWTALADGTAVYHFIRS